MSKIFITGSADGLGLRSAQALLARGHSVSIHARNASRAQDARQACPDAKHVFIADLTSAEETRKLATELNDAGPWDVVIHSAGVLGSRERGVIFSVNTLAPYLLTCLLAPRAKRYIFLSSSMHYDGNVSLRNLEDSSYSDTKLHNVMLASWFARRFGDQGVNCQVMDPGWVPTRMGGRGAPEDIGQAIETYVLLAEGPGDDEKGCNGRYWKSSKVVQPKAGAFDEGKQEELMKALEKMSGVSLPC